MPLGEFISDFFLHIFLEVVLAGASYGTGAIFLKVLTLGQLDLAPLHSRGEQNRTSDGTRDWSIWLHRSGKRRALKADWVCVAGFLVWIVAGVSIYQATKDSEPPENTGASAMVEE